MIICCILYLLTEAQPYVIPCITCDEKNMYKDYLFTRVFCDTHKAAYARYKWISSAQFLDSPVYLNGS